MMHAELDHDDDAILVDHRVMEQESLRYRLLRKVLIAQMNGDFDIATKLDSVLRGCEEPKTEADFDARMDRALAVMSN